LEVQLTACLQAFAWLYDRFPTDTYDGEMPLTFESGNPSCFVLWRCTEKGQHAALDVLDEIFDAMKQWMVLDVASLAVTTKYPSVADRIIRTYTSHVEISPLNQYDSDRPEDITEHHCEIQLGAGYVYTDLHEMRRRGALYAKVLEDIDDREMSITNTDTATTNTVTSKTLSWSARQARITALIQKFSSSIESLQAVETLINTLLGLLSNCSSPLEEWFVGAFYDAETVGGLWTPYVLELIAFDKDRAIQISNGINETHSNSGVIYTQLQHFIEHVVLHKHQYHVHMRRELWTLLCENIGIEKETKTYCSATTLLPWAQHDILFAQLVPRLVGDNPHMAELLQPCPDRSRAVKEFKTWKMETTRETNSATSMIVNKDNSTSNILQLLLLHSASLHMPERLQRRKWHDHLIIASLARNSEYSSITEKRERALRHAIQKVGERASVSGLYGGNYISDGGRIWHHRSVLLDEDVNLPGYDEAEEDMSAFVLQRTALHDEAEWKEMKYNCKKPDHYVQQRKRTRKQGINEAGDEEENEKAKELRAEESTEVPFDTAKSSIQAQSKEEEASSAKRVKK